MGITAPATEWFLAEGATGPYFDLFILIANPTTTAAQVEVDASRNLETYILVANTSATPADVKVTLMFEDGSQSEQTFAGIAGRSRFNVPVGHFFPAAAGKRFGATVESLGTPPAQIVVERAMYWDAVGQRWAAGTNALATRLR